LRFHDGSTRVGVELAALPEDSQKHSNAGSDQYRLDRLLLDVLLQALLDFHGALAALFGAVGHGNQVLSKTHSRELAGWVEVTRRMLGIFGLDPYEQWPTAGAELRPALDGVMEVVLDLRSSARARRDFTEADAIRARLLAAGLVVEDTPEGQRWHLA